MRILYGAFAQGHGHFSKASVLVHLLESRGHEVRVVSSGWDEPPRGYRFTWHRHFPGLAYAVTNGRTDFSKTFWKWAGEAHRVLANLWRLRAIVREFEPDVILSDFEPLTASPLLAARCEVIALSRQAALIDRTIPLPPGNGFERKIARTVFRLFTSGADRLYGYHYEPASYRCLPPIIRPDLWNARPETGEHVLVYNHYHMSDGGDAESLIQWASHRRQPVRAYGFPQMPRGRHGWVEFRPPDSAGMLDDMRTARAVITSAGLTTPLEAFLLGKPVVLVPIPNHWEQRVNAFHLENAGLARWCRTWDYDALLDTPAPRADHPLLGWLRFTPEQILDRVLDGTAAIRAPEDSQRRAAA